MGTPVHVAETLTEHHWLFFEEQPAESLPAFYPRSLDFGQSSSQSIQTSPFQPRPRVGGDWSDEEESSPIHHEAPSPIFNPASPTAFHDGASPVYVPQGSPRVSGPSSARPAPLQPAAGVLTTAHRLKRDSEPSCEDAQRPRKFSRLSALGSTNTSDRGSRGASSDSTSPSTAPPSPKSTGPPKGFDYERFDHIMEIHGLRAELAASESRNASAQAELAESRSCIDFLMGEVRRLISSGQEHQILSKAQRIVRSTDNHVPLFTRASPVTTHPEAPPQDSFPALQAACSEALYSSNPYSSYFSEEPTAAADFEPTTLPSSSSSTFAPVGPHYPFASHDFVSYCEMASELSREYLPSQSTSLATQPLPGASLNPYDSHSAQEWSHDRLDSYMSLYYTEPSHVTDPLRDIA